MTANVDPAYPSPPEYVIHFGGSSAQPFAVFYAREQGKAVWIAQPKIEDWDYNDMLMHQGLATVKKELQQAISYSDYQDQIMPGFLSQKELSADVEKKSLCERVLSVDKNPVIKRSNLKSSLNWKYNLLI